MEQHPTNVPASAASDGTPPEAAGDTSPTPATAAPVTAQAAAGAPEPAPAPSAPAEPQTPDHGDDIAPEFELVEVVYRGRKWNVPKDRGQWDMNVQFEFEEGRRLRGFFILLGGSPENVPATKEQVYSVCRTNREVDEFMDHLTEILNKECIG